MIFLYAMLTFFVIPSYGEVLPPTAVPLCDLKAKGMSLPDVIIIGEHHKEPASVGTRMVGLIQGATGVFPVVSELGLPRHSRSGNFFPHLEGAHNKDFNVSTQQSKLHGLESQIGYSLIISFETAIELLYEDHDPRDILYEYFTSVQDLSLFRIAFEILASSGSGQVSPVAKALLAVLDKEYIDTQSKELAYINEVEKRFSKTQIKELIEAHHREVVADFNHNYLQYYEGGSLPVITSKKIADRFGYQRNKNIARSGSTYSKVMRDMRDQDFGHRVAQLVCDYSGKEEKLIILVGDGHAKGIRKYLREVSDSNIKMRTLGSFHGLHKKEISEALEVPWF